MNKVIPLTLLVTLVSGCATVSRPRVEWGMAIGGAAGAIGGGALSPNDASRGWNAAVFGAIGAVAGGLIGYLTEPKAPTLSQGPSLKAQELAPPATAKEVELKAPEGLPGFVKDRLQPVVIEEYQEPDTVTPDGELHEPHKVYRIVKPAELFARPVTQATTQAPTPEAKP